MRQPKACAVCGAEVVMMTSLAGVKVAVEASTVPKEKRHERCLVVDPALGHRLHACRRKR